MRLLRLCLFAVLLVAPGCLVVTCGTSRTLPEEGVDQRAPATSTDSARDAGAGW